MSSKSGLSLMASLIDDIRNLKTSESKTAVLRVLGMMGFYNTYILNFQETRIVYNSMRVLLVASETKL